MSEESEIPMTWFENAHAELLSRLSEIEKIQNKILVQLQALEAPLVKFDGNHIDEAIQDWTSIDGPRKFITINTEK